MPAKRGKARSDAAKQKFHRLYAMEDADFTLKSSDGVLFKVHSPILKLSSVFFRDLLAMPRDPLDVGMPVEIAEKSDVLEALLRIIYPHDSTPPKPMILEFMCTLQKAAEKYEMHYVTSYIRKEVMVRDDDPVALYTLALRSGWKDIARYASVQALRLSLKDILDTKASMKDLNAVELSQLLLHRFQRKDEVMEYIKEAVKQPHDCGDWGRQGEPSFTALQGLKCHISTEITECPRGDTLRLISPKSQYHHASPVWTEKCQFCKIRLVDAIIPNINERIESMNKRDWKNQMLPRNGSKKLLRLNGAITRQLSDH